ncbi:MAG TPA: hypothetical protein VFB21_10915 [Chthonomonadaceae bacterium]|nr:hypothetical protein [Chthonomonadaceae bacterium]
MSQSNALTPENIRKFVAAWYAALDVHAPVEECYRFLSDECLDMQFPDGKICDFTSFKTWYDRVTHLFFDENHNVQSVEIQISGEEAVADIVVGWQASWFEPPAAKSKRVSMNATQRWRIRPSNKNAYGLEITYYNATVKPFEYAPGFAML